MPAVPRAPLLSRVPARLLSVLAWSGFLLSPFVMYLGLTFGSVTTPFLPASARYVLPILALLLLIGVLRERPLVALALMLGEAAVVEIVSLPRLHWDPGFHSEVRYMLILGADVAVGYLAATHRRSVSFVTAVVALAFQLAVAVTVRVLPGLGNLGDTATRDLLAMVSAWVIGYAIQQSRQYGEGRRAQAEIQAVQAERLRIARELHDMIAHSIGVIAIQAGVGGRVIDTQPAEARKALRAIEDTSRETLAGLRRILGALRGSEPGSDAELLGAAPGLDGLDQLVTRAANAGVRVELCRSGVRGPLPPDIDLSAFRVIQEAITNVVRHSGTHTCRVVVDQRPDELTVEVTDNGRGGVEGAGYGIPGMRERVALLNGDFTVGPRPEGGFRVAARIPIPAVVP